jgi:signal peptidase I
MVNILLAFIIIKYAVYPGLGAVFGTSHPIVAVVSGSMEHDGSFEDWWSIHHTFYEDLGITKEEFQTYTFKNGFNTGDIIILKGTSVENTKRGDVVVFWSGRSDPIIHRTIKLGDTLQTKGDHNIASNSDEMAIEDKQIIGKAFLRVPYLGWIKILFVNAISIFR